MDTCKGAILRGKRQGNEPYPHQSTVADQGCSLVQPKKYFAAPKITGLGFSLRLTQRQPAYRYKEIGVETGIESRGSTNQHQGTFQTHLKRIGAVASHLQTQVIADRNPVTTSEFDNLMDNPGSSFEHLPGSEPYCALDVDVLGQVFTPDAVVDFMVAGIRNRGRVLEPSCGNGAFLNRLRGRFDVVGVELDARHCPADALQQDFFALPTHEKFDTIIGNPPYVRYQDIAASTREKLDRTFFDERSNLYLFFIRKSVLHLNPGGELIFITPRDFLKSTNAILLNRWLYAEGTITHVVDMGDAKIFDNAVPNCLIWRYERGNRSRIAWYAPACVGQSISDRLASLSAPDRHTEAWESRQFSEQAGNLLFTRNPYPVHLSAIAAVKVGAVSGDDEVFADEQHGTADFVCSSTAQTGRTRRMIWSPLAPHPILLAKKQRLLNRRIKTFDENNWWHWGRGFPQTDAPRIYVNAKTRNSRPFFLHRCNHFDGSVLALFPHDSRVNLRELCDALNDVDWEELGFVCDGRFLFSQRSLENAPLPESFSRYIGSDQRTLELR